MICFISISVLLLIVSISIEVQKYYKFNFEWIQGVDLNKVLIVWYNKYSTEDGSITREHKILYDTGRNKK
jgi:hypothetical protein